MEKDVQITKIAYGGQGLGTVDGKVCFVEGALAGEKARVRITQKKKNYMKAKVVEILEPSEHRLDPPCHFIKQCGGCQYQHLSYPQELEWKRTQVQELFETQLKLDGKLVQPIVSCNQDYRYRNHLTLHEERKPSGQYATFGFIGKDNHSLVDIDDCHLTNDHLADVFVNPDWHKRGAKHLTYYLSEDEKIYSSLKGEFFSVKVGSESLLTHTKGFFQNNLAVTEKVAEQIKKWVEEYEPKVFADLYAGVGTFAILSALDVPQLLCVESNPYSVEALRKNLSQRKSTAQVLDGEVEKLAPAWLEENGQDDMMLMLDPPRKGLNAKFAKFLSEWQGYRTCVYLSCHLGTLTRDLKTILNNGSLEVQAVVPFDMFPRTKHIEVMALMRRK